MVETRLTFNQTLLSHALTYGNAAAQIEFTLLPASGQYYFGYEFDRVVSVTIWSIIKFKKGTLCRGEYPCKLSTWNFWWAMIRGKLTRLFSFKEYFVSEHFLVFSNSQFTQLAFLIFFTTYPFSRKVMRKLLKINTCRRILMPIKTLI